METGAQTDSEETDPPLLQPQRHGEGPRTVPVGSPDLAEAFPEPAQDLLLCPGQDPAALTAGSARLMPPARPRAARAFQSEQKSS